MPPPLTFASRMSKHQATIFWSLADTSGADFLKGRYSREHEWSFDGGLKIAASPSPSVVPVPWSNPAHVDPEEAYVASVASCHMLTFLWLAGRKGFAVASYEDCAVGTMAKNAQGTPWVERIALRPRIDWSGEKIPTAEEISHLHHAAHEGCFIANSIKTEVVIESTPVAP